MLGNLMLLILLLFPSLFVYSDSVGKALDSNIQYMEQLNNQANLNVNLLFSPLDRVNFIHYSDGELRRILLADASEKSSIERFEDDTYLRNALNHAFRNDSFVVRGGIVNQYGDAIAALWRIRRSMASMWRVSWRRSPGKRTPMRPISPASMRK